MQVVMYHIHVPNSLDTDRFKGNHVHEPAKA